MDNATIHKKCEITNLIDKCGCTPPHAPFLNPIELLWLKAKGSVRREMLTLNNDFSTRTVESAKAVAIQDYVNWIKHSMSFFDRCLALGPNL